MVRAGGYRHTITIQARTIARDSGGGITAGSAWATVTDGERPAKVLCVGSEERYTDDQQQTVRRYEIYTRYLEGVTPAHRVTFSDGYETVTMDVRSSLDLGGRRRELKLEGIERLAL